MSVVVVRTVRGYWTPGFSPYASAYALSFGSLLIVAALTGLAGLLTARRTGSVATGVLAGLLAAAVRALGGSATVGVYYFSRVVGARYANGAPVPLARVWEFALGVALINLVIALALDEPLGAITGVLGGLIGAGQKRRAIPPGARAFVPVLPTPDALASVPPVK
jgi:hypothetical protein